MFPKREQEFYINIFILHNNDIYLYMMKSFEKEINV